MLYCFSVRSIYQAILFLSATVCEIQTPKLDLILIVVCWFFCRWITFPNQTGQTTHAHIYSGIVWRQQPHPQQWFLWIPQKVVSSPSGQRCVAGQDGFKSEGEPGQAREETKSFASLWDADANVKLCFLELCAVSGSKHWPLTGPAEENKPKPEIIAYTETW